MEQTLPILTVLIGIGFAATVAVLLAGIVGMAVGNDFNRRHGNRMMRLRVIFQGITVALVVVFLLIKMGL
ncbi:MAG: twin transmembrane helix small protein [Magnetovibrionaceae bacterium]